MALGGGSVALPLNQHLNSASRTLAKTPIEGQYFLDGNQSLQDTGTTPVSPLADAADGNPATSATATGTPDYDVSFGIRGTATPLSNLISEGFIESARFKLEGARDGGGGIGTPEDIYILIPAWSDPIEFTFPGQLNDWIPIQLTGITSFSASDVGINMQDETFFSVTPGSFSISRALFAVTETMV